MTGMSDDDAHPPVRIALRADLARGSATLTAAFHEDPWFSWLYPDAERRPAQAEAWFGLVLERAFAMGHTFVTEHGLVTWAPIDVAFPTADDVALAATLLTEQIGERASTALGIIGGAGAVFPERPRFHCIYVGVQPEAQGTGRGVALLRRVLDTCDREGLPASLTSTNDTNLPFYRHLGFTEIGETAIADTGRSLRPLWREPR
jgi:GNAT superfamily N-acetyltransferase